MTDARSPASGAVATDARWGIGIDVGGTKIAAAVVSLCDGRIMAQQRIPTQPERGGEAVLDDAVALAARIRAMAEEQGASVSSVGVGVAELVDLTGSVVSSFLIEWPGLPVAARFAEIAPTTIESDVRAAALAEARLGAGLPYDPFIYVTIGTGISYTLMIGGQPYAGARGAALAFASGAVSSVCPACETHHDLVLEAYAGGPALARRYAMAAGQNVDAAEDVLRAAGHDSIAANVIDTAAHAVGNALGLLVNTLDPAAIVIGGGLGNAPGRYRDRLIAETRAHIWNPAARNLPMLPAAFGADAGVIGAALAGSLGPANRPDRPHAIAAHPTRTPQNAERR